MNFALSVIVKTTALLACASLMTLGLRRASASVRHAVWAIALLTALILPVASAILPALVLPVLPEEPAGIHSALLIAPGPTVGQLMHALRENSSSGVDAFQLGIRDLVLQQQVQREIEHRGWKEDVLILRPYERQQGVGQAAGHVPVTAEHLGEREDQSPANHHGPVEDR